MRQTYQFILLLLTGVFFYSCQGDELTNKKMRLDYEGTKYVFRKY